MTVRALIERIKDHLFFVPAVFVAAAAVLAWIVNRLEPQLDANDLLLLIPTSIVGARSLLSTIAAATITVAGLVFSIMAVTVQLSSSQYSPRVLDRFLRDRFQQLVIGVVVGTFTYSLISLATLGVSVERGEAVTGAVAATVGLVLGVASVLAIVAFIDRIVRSLRVDDMIRELAAETRASVEALFPEDPPADDAATLDLPLESEPVVVTSRQTGWIQHLDIADLVERVPDGSAVQILVPIGGYVVSGDTLAKIWGDTPEGDAAEVARASVTVGNTRTIEQDPGFGLRQLADIASRALSPGINDPATAADVVRHLVEPLHLALSRPPRPRVHRSEGGARIELPLEPVAEDWLNDALTEVRIYSSGHPIVLAALVEALGALRDRLATEAPDRIDLIDAQLDLVRRTISASPLSGADLGQVRRAFRRHGLDED